MSEDPTSPRELLTAAEPATIAYGLGMCALGVFFGVRAMSRYLYPVPPTGWLDHAQAVSWWALLAFTALLLGAFAIDQYRA